MLAEQYYHDKFIQLANSFLSVSILRNIGSQWLSIRLQLIGVFISTSVALFAIICSAYDLIEIDGAQLGLVLVYSLSIVNNLNGLVTSFTDTEQSMISVERIFLYINAENESTCDDIPDVSALSHPNSDCVDLNPLLSSSKMNSDNFGDSEWPRTGDIRFLNMSMRYTCKTFKCVGSKYFTNTFYCLGLYTPQI